MRDKLKATLQRAIRKLRHSLLYIFKTTFGSPPSNSTTAHTTSPFLDGRSASSTPNSSPATSRTRLYTRRQRARLAELRFLALRARLHVLEKHPAADTSTQECLLCQRGWDDEDGELEARVHQIEQRNATRALIEENIAILDFAAMSDGADVGLMPTS